MRASEFVLNVAGIIALAGTAYAGRGAWTTSWPADSLVSALAASPGSPSVLYAGLNTSSGGGFPSDIYSSSDDGRSWQSLDHPNYKNEVGAIAVIPTIPATLLVGESGDRVYQVPGSLIRSADGGKTWSQIGPALPWGAAIAVDPAEPRRIWSGFDGGLFVSDDGGDTWGPRAIDVFGGGVTSLAIDSGRFHAIYASGFHGDADPGTSAKSDDGGLTWKIIEPFACGGVAKFAVDSLTGNVYAAQEFGGPCQAFTVSEDGGATWRNLPFPATANFYFADFAIDPTSPGELVWTSPEGTSISRDGGESWSPLGEMESAVACCSFQVVFDPDGGSVHVSGGVVFDYTFSRVVSVPSRSAPVVRR